MSNAANQRTGYGPKGWLEKRPSASLFIHCISHRICSSLTPFIQTLLEANAAWLLFVIRCTSPIFRFVFVGLLFVVGFGPRSSAEIIDQRNFAIDTYYPTPNEIRLAEQRARNYWAKNANRYGSNPVYLAVETSKIFESEIVQDLWPKLINSQTTTTYFAKSGGRHKSEVDLKGIVIFDTRTGTVASNRGFVSVDTPSRGRVARF